MFRLLCIVIIAVMLCYVNYAYACGGYKIRFNSVENCGGANQIISIDKNFTAVLSPSCEISTKGCVTSKGFTQAKVKYSISKNGVVMLTGNPNVCDELDKKSEDAKARLQMFGFPTECPVPEGRRCFDGDKKINITKFKNYLNMANGKMAINADIEHDTGKSCLKINFELHK